MKRRGTILKLCFSCWRSEVHFIRREDEQNDVTEAVMCKFFVVFFRASFCTAYSFWLWRIIVCLWRARTCTHFTWSTGGVLHIFR